MSCIRASGITKSYGAVNAVAGVDLEVESGQVFGFLGPNGAGKSTTIKLLTTLMRPDSGSLSILGMDAFERPLDIRKRIGVVLQQPSYEPTLTVLQSLVKYGMMWGVSPAERKRRAEKLLEDFELEEIRGKKNEDLSIGQRRRVQVAREFMHDMDLLFLDEPTVGLDPASRRKLLDYLKDRVKSGLTIFFTTHVLTEAEYICDKVAIISGGRIIAVDTPSDLKKRFGSEKTIRIRTSGGDNLSGLLTGYGCTVEHGTDVTMRSADSSVLLQVLHILEENGIEIEDLSAVPTNLEEIFLKVVKDAPGS